ncbi:MAG TPA: exosortase system-associated protein, TIGR04073 family [Verrucomicrobiales bacterium]|jgi:putative exosortase-associated protein (TIGR04073 family)|nr:exosortase system-associated protein, TIGR04073 family [Verrucomicrobiales bacterium]
MKKLLLLFLTAGIAGLSVADIQAPPGAKFGPLRKLSRALANIVYGVTEVPVQMSRSVEEGGGSEAASYGLVYGGGKSLARLGYGIYELITFPLPTYKGGYRPPYHPAIREATHPSTGFLEFPPEVGFISGVQHNRTQVQ